MTADLSDVIRFISDRIADCNKPEYLSKWAEKAMKEMPSCRYAWSSRRRTLRRNARSMAHQIGRKLNKVENFEGYSLIEKLQLAFIFSRPVSDEFVQTLKNAKFEIEQDGRKRISRFCTEDKRIVPFSEHNQGLKYFQGDQCLHNSQPRRVKNKRMSRKKEQGQQDVANENPSSEVSAARNVIRYISDRIGIYEKPESLSKWCKEALKEFSPRSLNCMRSSVRDKLGRIERLEGYSLMEKLQLVFIFSQPVSDGFVKLLKDAKFKIEQDERKRISRFSTENGNVVRFSDHHRDVKYFHGVLSLNSPFTKRVNDDSMAREKEQEQQDIEYENPGPNCQKVKEKPVANILIEPKQEVTDAKVKKEPTEDISFLKEPKQEVVEQPIKQEVDDYIDFGVDVSQGAFNGRINYEELDNQKGVYPGFPQISKSALSTRAQKRHHSATTDNGKHVKTEKIESEATSSDSVQQGLPQIAKSASSIRTQKRHHSATTDNGKRVKTKEIESKATSSDSIASSADK
ncbi:Protein CBG14326 [Caenorhabditis briggsae]|uniref:Protein CBG14326 n=3 Tax=Caenorhabditis briggsae TaxID=6238 RepID=A8XJS0_CAEBR|nr:Protein CBG14326 [Caenorhabditis briggsae]ULT81953.1 hypothetical protein L3Y34_011725 [Caenorhabditis briggsae]CAP32896.1 Protein CBG14326 [Caenorhabditis briggsae]